MLSRLIPSLSPRVSIALLLLRIAAGYGYIQHGIPKWIHPLTWADHFAPLPGIPHVLQLCVSVAENIGGGAIIAGLLTPLFAFMQVVDMSVVILGVKAAHGMPYVGAAGKSWEIEGHLWLISLVLLICGPGRYSLDSLIAGWRERGESR